MITGLHHLNLRAPAPMLAVLRDFYRDALGLEPGPRPNFGTSGYWLYAGGHPVLHLSEQAPHEPRRGAVDPAAPTTYDHTAFAGTDPEATAAQLRQLGVAFHESRSAVTGQHQFFLQDPAGNGVEINFPF
ncbi:VOC family protein [Pelomonas aquatica]|jgi:catechol 2,3-dioxygenase-like lactoylglutathione lyase family enzyme|uniref:Diguanylate cyclase n=1 Tax=Pelomonas aquatica TaxID=431058 RepID=A0A9X4LGG4_9BURK|nr:VOC family protein [Pelomonas aquatica]MCY4756461.1 VOC family protein [Pelomonas aquatica]MDG0863075.1 diguanylate cyclase [Pelomonas aquatica]